MQWEASDASGTVDVSQIATSSTPARRALANPQILRCLAHHLSHERLVTNARAHRQANIRLYTLVCKAWLEPFSRELWRNPFFGVAERGQALHECLRYNPARGKLIDKLIFGEGTSTDVSDWPSHECVPDILSAATEVRIVGFDGLHNVDLEAFRRALITRAHLVELRACDLLPEPWCFGRHLFDDLIAPCQKLVRLRLYNISSEHVILADARKSLGQSDSTTATGSRMSPRTITRGFQRVALNHCAMSASSMRHIFGNSSTSLEELRLELPLGTLGTEVLDLVRIVGKGLKTLDVYGPFRQAESNLPFEGGIIDHILACTPSLETLSFPEANISYTGVRRLLGSSLRMFSFACSAEVRPHHWLEAFADPQFPSPASCRIYIEGWTSSEVRDVRLAATKIGVNWLTRGSDEEFVDRTSGWLIKA